MAEGIPNEGRDGDAPSDVEKPAGTQQYSDPRTPAVESGNDTTGGRYSDAMSDDEDETTPADGGEFADEHLPVDQGDDDRDPPTHKSDDGDLTGK